MVEMRMKQWIVVLLAVSTAFTVEAQMVLPESPGVSLTLDTSLISNKSTLQFKNSSSALNFLLSPNKLPANNYKEYRARLRQLTAVQFNDYMQIGLDSFKVQAGAGQQIVELAPHLQPKSSTGKSARGYGIGFKIKLD